MFNKHIGLFKYRRLPLGLSSSPGILQKFISQLITQIEGVATYLDDIIICGEKKAVHDERLLMVLQVLQDHNGRINKGKSMLHVKSIGHLRYRVSDELIFHFLKLFWMLQHLPLWLKFFQSWELPLLIVN